jgi:signal transduction histidine kinase
VRDAVGPDRAGRGAGGSPGADVEALVRAEQVRALYARNATAQATVLLNSALAVAVLRGDARSAALLAWAAALWAIAAARLALGAAYRRAAPPAADAGRWGAWFTIGAALNGVCWGASPLLVGPSAPLTHLVFLAFVLGGMAAGGAVSNAARPPAFLAFAVPALVPMLLVLAAGGDRIRLAMALLLAAFGAAVAGISRLAGRAFDEAVRLRFTNAELARGLAELNAGLEARVAERTAELEATQAREREAEQQLAAAARLATVGAVAAGVAHEINSPLGSVRANLGFLRAELPRTAADPAALADIEEALAEATADVDRVSGFVRHLVALSLAEPPAALEPVDLEAILDDCLARVRDQLPERVRFRRAYGTVPVALAHRARLVHVFTSLLRSAPQAAPEGAVHEIRIATRHDAEGGWVLAEVSDTCCVLAPAAVDRLWDPFSTAAPQARSPLELPVCRSLVAALGGRLTARSGGGEGTTFTVWLRVAPRPGAA